MVVLAGLVWLVLRHDADALWLASPAGDGGVLVPNADLERPASSAAGRAHPDVRAHRGRALQRGARRCAGGSRSGPGRSPTPAPCATRSTRPCAARSTRLTGRELERLDVRVKVLKVTQLARYLP